MDTARRRASRPGTGAALARKLGAALAVIVVTSGAFAFVGTLEDQPTADPVAAGDQDAETPAAADEPSPEDTTPSGTASEPEPTATAEPAEDASEEPAPEVTSEEPEPASEPEPEPEPEPTSEEPAATIPPGEISIQVLDGYKVDDGAAMRGLAEELRGQGYRVVAENQALDYQVTTVLWTAGNEAAARQVAAAIGAGDVHAQPGNLSEAVTVHVVVGADRG